ncbi:uncharacterized protein LOC133911549 isoform X2 [Phragmites australis]|uniref:uncharacterized protein LOC133911549 isoform X2 n=1 Tax=Phragmites australis TaxID=29695 RepID=UPI002D79CE56|nr:uncharacterized protein LOC133911549 isoform X2 [Phragmites australis]
MDRRILRSASFNGCGKNLPPSSPVAGSRTAAAAAAGSKDDTAAGERKALLPRQPSGGMARKSHKGPKRRVQWKDRHGKKLTEVLEFQPRLLRHLVREEAQSAMDKWVRTGKHRICRICNWSSLGVASEP